MSILLSDEEFTGLRERVIELETLLNQVEAKKVGVFEEPALARFTASDLAPVASPVPLNIDSDVSTAWPSSWSSALEPELVPEVAPTLEPVVEEAASEPLASREAEVALPEAERVLEAESVVEPVIWSVPEVQATPVSSKRDVPRDKAHRSLLDWETLIGGQLALWVGALCLFLALASLLVYVGKTLPPPTPAMRVATGLVGSFALISCALAARIRGQRWFVDGLLGTGLAVGFLSVWGGGPHFALWSVPFSVAGFGLYAGAGIVLSARRNSQALLILSAVGGFLTPLFIHHDNAHGVAFAFSSYLLVLNAGILAVCVTKQWREIIYGAFIATVVLCLGWALEGNVEKVRLLLWTSASLGWVLFAGASCFRAFKWKEETRAEDAALLIGATGIYAATSQWFLAPLLHGVEGAFSAGLMAVLVTLWMQTKRRLPQDELLGTCFLAMSCAAGVLAIPLQFGQSGLVWGWMSQSGALWMVASKTKSDWLRNASRALWGLALLSLAFDFLPALHNGASPLDGISLHLLFCLGITACLLSDEERDWTALYGIVLSCGGSLWIGRALWLVIARTTVVSPAHETEATILTVCSAIILWSLGLWRVGWWRREAFLRLVSSAQLGTALCVIAIIGVEGTAPLQGLRVFAFVVGAVAMALVGFWHTRHEAVDGRETREIVALSTSAWVLLGSTIAVAAYFNGGRFGVLGMGTTGWFVLCALWSVLAAVGGALSMWKTWPKLWALAEAVFAGSAGVLLLQSLLLPHALLPLGNARLGAFVVAWGVALLARQVEGGQQEQRANGWLLAVLLLPLWASTQELWNGVEVYHAAFGPEWERFASLGVSLWWSLYAMLCLAVGVSRRAQNMRIGALSLGALAVCKVFLLDLAFLDGGLRVLSLGGLGAALLFISWLYSRFGRLEKSALVYE